MSIVVRISALASRIERRAIAGQTGIRRFAENGIIPRPTGSGGTANFWDGLARFGASLLANLTWKPPWMNINFAALWAKAVQGYNFAFNFDINITDKQIDEQMKQAEIALAAARGAAKGATLGYLVCGIIPTATIAVFNEAAALYVLKNVGEEAAEEIAGHIATLSRLQFQQTMNKTFYTFFKNNRTLVRNAILGSAKLLQFFRVPIDDEEIAKANQKRNQPWSLALAMDETIEKISDPVIRIETEETWEEFGEACIEIGYVVANSLDAWMLESNASQPPPDDEDVIIINPSGAIS